VIRETYQDPSQFGKVSFPALKAPIRPGDLQDDPASEYSDEEEAEVDEAAEETEETTPSVEEEAASSRSLDEPYFG
jgi:hypothetical protein